jgi:hypothetical protein
MERERWHGVIKDYDGGTLMECVIHPRCGPLPHGSARARGPPGGRPAGTSGRQGLGLRGVGEWARARLPVGPPASPRPSAHPPNPARRISYTALPSMVY